MKKFFLTSPIFYPNSRLHIGHAYTMTIADIISRYKKISGYEVYFQTGSDDHGEKIEKTASSLKKTPQNLVDQNVLLFRELWQELGVNYDIFYRTSSALHKKTVQRFFTKLLNQGDIYLGKYKGEYCVTCEDYIKNFANVEEKQVCPTCFSITKTLEEDAYFFRVSKYQKQLSEYYQSNPDFLIPFDAKKELFANFLKDNVRDLCITRNDIYWGIPIPNNSKMTIYVWFEALCNYVTSNIGKKAFDDNNYQIIHLVGKEIARFHALYWPIILFALEKRLPNKVIAHGWIITPQGGKMSKSKGNVIDPLQLLKKYPKDLLRLYFIAKINFLQDGIFSQKILESFYRDFFINDLGNYCQRVSKMIEIYSDCIIPDFRETKNNYLKKYHQDCLEAIKIYQQKMNNYQLTAAFQEIEKLLSISNKLIEELKPWQLSKDISQLDLLKTTLNYLANGIKTIAFLLNPIIPDTSKIIFDNLNLIEYQDFDYEKIKDMNMIANKKIKILTNPFFAQIL